MAAPYSSTLTIDGTKINAVWTLVKFSARRDRAGMPEMASLETTIKVCIDFHDDANVPHSSLKKLFELANTVTRDKIKDVKIEFWKDEAHQDALCSYAFRGWISGFEMSTPPSAAGDNGNQLNHKLTVEIEPALNQANYKEIQMGN